MAGALTISTLNNDTGVLATQNGMNGIAKAWISYNSNTTTINGSFNISSVTYNGTGDVTMNFTTAMPNSNYVVTASSQSDPAVSPQGVAIFYARTPNAQVSPTTSAFRVSNMRQSDGLPLNNAFICCAVFSS